MGEHVAKVHGTLAGDNKPRGAVPGVGLGVLEIGECHFAWQFHDSGTPCFLCLTRRRIARMTGQVEDNGVRRFVSRSGTRTGSCCGNGFAEKRLDVVGLAASCDKTIKKDFRATDLVLFFSAEGTDAEQGPKDDAWKQPWWMG